MAIDDGLDNIDNFRMYSFKYCPYCGKDAKEATQTIQTCHGGQVDDGVIGHHFNCPCEKGWVDWYKYDETSR